MGKSTATFVRRGAGKLGALALHRFVHQRILRPGHPVQGVVDQEPQDVACPRRIGFAARNRFGSSSLFASRGDPIGAGRASAARFPSAGGRGRRRIAAGRDARRVLAVVRRRVSSQIFAKAVRRIRHHPISCRATPQHGRASERSWAAFNTHCFRRMAVRSAPGCRSGNKRHFMPACTHVDQNLCSK